MFECAALGGPEACFARPREASSSAGPADAAARTTDSPSGEEPLDKETSCAEFGSLGWLLGGIDSPEKVIYDVRGDADALFRLYGLKLANVLDMQVLYHLIHDGPDNEYLCQGNLNTLNCEGLSEWKMLKV